MNNKGQGADEYPEKCRNMWLSGIFFLILFTFTIVSILKPDIRFSENENRFLKEKPAVSVDTVLSGEFGIDYELYLGDQFPWRNQFIAMKTTAERAAGKSETGGVYFAEDGYLIERYGTEDVDSELAEENIEKSVQFLADSTIRLGKERVSFLLVPGASEVLTDKLPFFAAGYDQQKLIDDVERRMREKGLGNRLTDAGKILKEHVQEEIYYKTDHHWTTLGAYYGYQAWAEQTALPEAYEIEDEKFVPLHMYRQIKVTDDFTGTIYSKVNRKTVKDSIYMFERILSNKESKRWKITYNMGEKETDTYYNLEKLKTKDKYAMFLDGNQAVVQVTNVLSDEEGAVIPDTAGEDGKFSENARRLLVIKDSYANCFIPFAAEHFQEVYVIDLRYFHMPVKEWMEEQQITDVLMLYSVMNFVKAEGLEWLNR